ncbi:sister chromatid cohesion protein 1 [Chytridiales sp. JEL 0842]|nr:sister chromatid cohesion protein 1 [Chytridiales sp. JEL 0842]
MFYSESVLSKKGALAKVWLAAHWERKLSKTQFLQTNIQSSVGAIVGDGHEPMALRLSGQLLLGVVRIFSRKARYLLEDCNEALVKIKMAFRPGVVDLPEDQAAANFNAITLGDGVTEFDIRLPEPTLDFRSLLASIQQQEEFIPSQSSQNTSRLDDITIRESQSFSMIRNDDLLGDDLEQGLGDAGDMLSFDLNANGVNERQQRVSFSLDDIEVGRDAAPERSFAPDGSFSFDAPRKSGAGEADDAFAMDNGPIDDFGPVDDFGPPDDFGPGKSLSFDKADALPEKDANFSFQLDGDAPSFAVNALEPLETNEGVNKENEFDDVLAGDNVPGAFTIKSKAKVTKTLEKQKEKKAAATRKRKLIVDDSTELPSKQMMQQLKDASDITTQEEYIPLDARFIELRDVKRRITSSCLSFVAFRGSGIPSQMSMLFDYSSIRLTMPHMKSVAYNPLVSPVELPLDMSFRSSKNMSTPLSGKKRKEREAESDEEEDEQNKIPKSNDVSFDAAMEPLPTNGDFNGNDMLDMLPPAAEPGNDHAAGDDFLDMAGGDDNLIYQGDETDFQTDLSAAYDKVQVTLPQGLEQEPNEEEAEDKASEVDDQEGENGGQGLSKSTVDTIEILSSNFAQKGKKKPLSYRDLAQDARKPDAVRLFFELLVLKTRDMVHVEQKEAYGDIQIFYKWGPSKSNLVKFANKQMVVHEELKSTVSDVLAKKGILSKIKAELRASIFSVLQEAGDGVEDSTTIPGASIVSSKEGQLALELVRDFLSFYSLEYTKSVLEPELGLTDAPSGSSLSDFNLPPSDVPKPMLIRLLENRNKVDSTTSSSLSAGSIAGKTTPSVPLPVPTKIPMHINPIPLNEVTNKSLPPLTNRGQIIPIASSSGVPSQLYKDIEKDAETDDSLGGDDHQESEFMTSDRTISPSHSTEGLSNYDLTDNL